jgi:hypothetical protein
MEYPSGTLLIGEKLVDAQFAEQEKKFWSRTRDLSLST